MGSRSGILARPACGVTLSLYVPPGVKQSLESRLPFTHLSIWKDKKEITSLHVQGKADRLTICGGHNKWRDVSSGAMLFDAGVGTGNDELEPSPLNENGSATPGHQARFVEQASDCCQPIGFDKVSANGSIRWIFATNDAETSLSPDQNHSSSYFPGSNSDDVEQMTADGRNSKDFEQLEHLQETNISRDRQEGNSSGNTVSCLLSEDLAMQRGRQGHINDALQDFQDAKVKETKGILTALRRIRLGCARSISRAVRRSFKTDRKPEAEQVDENLIARETTETVTSGKDGGDDNILDVDITETVNSSKHGAVDQATGTSVRDKEDELDEIPWDVLKGLWENPAFVKFRVSISMANLTMAIPTFLARALPLLSSVFRLSLLKGFSFPVLAPLLFGGGLVFKSAISNLGIVLPRMMTAMAIMWALWGLNHAIQEAIGHLKDTGSVDRRVATVLVLFVELTFSAIAVVTVLSSIGMNVNALLLPSFLALALAGKDVWQNYFAGFFLFAAQPFRPGHTVALMCGHDSVGSHTPSPPNMSGGMPKSGWFEGVCEAVDLRYTVIRNGQYRLVVPNAIFVKREFMIMDAEPVVVEPCSKPNARAKGRQKQNRGEAGKGTPRAKFHGIQDLSGAHIL